MTAGKTLVAGIGNIFLGDDAFGVEVVGHLARRELPAGVKVTDFGIRGIHLAYELLDGVDLLILVDAARRGERPGTVTVNEIHPAPGEPTSDGVVDAHDLSPDSVLDLIDSLGAPIGRTLLVACEPVDLASGMGLSEPVAAAVPVAVETIVKLLTEQSAPVPGGRGVTTS